ncbi:DUF349 domain-containing protein [Auraticoccus sp. F435]|uniref:DUF349 domain-containing protein n=1 Tax=Auraticoccus cholistanensis TaxID=2656650 RepID=A0A6A9USP3_9ACTN|nr:DUF349 domain-containing protein [Auraticoccus cholistanensis]MVA75946.1 DUF349 domain-containing protein [Auraticoccus cholistanensis]
MTQTPGPESFGRVAEDMTVYVRTADGERAVGQVPGVTPEEALAFYVRRFQALELEVNLLVARVRQGTLSPDEARKSIATVRSSLTNASAVGDLAALEAQLDSLAPALAEQAEQRRAARAQQAEATRTAKEKMVAEAEKLAAGNDWRGGVNRFRALLEEWKSLPRIDRATDEALWHRFSSARTTYTKRRKAQFAEQATRRESARVTKERIIAEAEKLATSTEWGPTSAAFRDLMQQWKAAGPAPREVDDKLWKRFRGLQDQFFGARQAEQEAQDAEFTGNQQAKEALLAEYEPQIVPVEDLERSRAAYRALLERWSEIGKVPRDAIRPLDNRMRQLETAIRTAEEEQWKRTDPEARARAEETAAKLRDQIATLEARAAEAEARGKDKDAQQAREAAETYRSWLEQAERAVQDFSG